MSKKMGGKGTSEAIGKIHSCQLEVTHGRLNMHIYLHSFQKPQENDSKGIKMAQTHTKEEKYQQKLDELESE